MQLLCVPMMVVVGHAYRGVCNDKLSKTPRAQSPPIPANCAAVMHTCYHDSTTALTRTKSMMAVLVVMTASRNSCAVESVSLRYTCVSVRRASLLLLSGSGPLSVSLCISSPPGRSSSPNP